VTDGVDYIDFAAERECLSGQAGCARLAGVMACRIEPDSIKRRWNWGERPDGEAERFSREERHP
jgi:hypothetical protein